MRGTGCGGIWVLLWWAGLCSVQFSSVAQSCPTLYDPRDCSTSGCPVHHQLLEVAQTHDHQVGDAIHPLLCLNYQKFGCGCPSRRGEAVLYITLAKAGHWAKKPQQNINVSLFVVPDSCPTLEIPEEWYSSQATNSPFQISCFLQLIFFSLLRSYATVLFFLSPGT